MTTQQTTSRTYSTGHLFHETVAHERVADRRREVEATMRSNALRGAISRPARTSRRRLAIVAAPIATALVLIVSSAL